LDTSHVIADCSELPRPHIANIDDGGNKDNSPTNQLPVSQVADWSTRRNV